MLPRQHAGQTSGGPHAIESLGQRTGYLERALDTELSLEACRTADNGVQRAYENIFFELPGAAEAQSFFQDGCSDERLTLQPHQQAQARPKPKHVFLREREG